MTDSSRGLPCNATTNMSSLTTLYDVSQTVTISKARPDSHSLGSCEALEHRASESFQCSQVNVDYVAWRDC